MSNHKIVALECPACKTEYDITYWQSLNAEIDPEAKEKLLSGELFTEVCPSCGKTNKVNYPLLYHDMKQKVMINLVLDKEKTEWNPRGIASDFSFLSSNVLDGYRFRIVRSQNTLREKAKIFNCCMDDRIIEIMKCFHWKHFIDENQSVALNDIYFNDYNSLFIFEFLADDNKLYTMKFNMDMYKLISNEVLHAIEYESKDNYSIDKEWAHSFVEKYFKQ